jgi:hypothetical protein
MKPLQTLAACLLLLTSHAQQIMPRIGASMTNVRLEGVVSNYNTLFAPGFMTGVSSQFDLGDKMGIIGDLLFTQKGWRSESEGPDNTGTSSNRIYYSELLCMPYYKWRNIFFLAGPGLSYGLFGRTYQEYEFTNGDSFVNDWPVRFTEADDARYSETYMDRRLTFNWQVGVGIELWERVLIDLRYQEAMMDHHFPVKPSQRPSRMPAGWYQSVQVSTAVRLSRG